MASQKMNDLPGNQGAYCPEHKSTPIDKSLLKPPSPIYDDILVYSNCNYRLVSSYQWLISSGRVGLINSGGECKPGSDWQNAIIIAMVNKHSSDIKSILGRKAFERPFARKIELLNALQVVYLDKDITIA